MPATMTLTLDLTDWQTITSALYAKAGDLAAHEARRTGGHGFASGGVAAQVADLHRIRDVVLAGKTDDGVRAFPTYTPREANATDDTRGAT